MVLKKRDIDPRSTAIHNGQHSPQLHATPRQLHARSVPCMATEGRHKHKRGFDVAAAIWLIISCHLGHLFTPDRSGGDSLGCEERLLALEKV